MPLGMELGLGSGDNVLDGDQAPPTERGIAAPCHFSAHVNLLWLVVQLRIRQAGWFLRRDCTPRSECPQFGMLSERRAERAQIPNL